MNSKDKNNNISGENKKHQIKKKPGDEIEKLKAEILKEVSSEKKNKKSLNWASLAVTATLVILAVISVGQTVQSASILQKINSGDLGPLQGSAVAAPSSLESLPDMVGGC